MKNAGETQIATRYVSALFDVAQQAKAVAQVEKDLKELAATASRDEGFAGFLGNPLLSAPQQVSVVNALSDRFGVHATTKAFLVTLAAQKRLKLLAEIARQFAKKAEDMRGELTAELITAQPVSKEELTAVADRLARAYGKTIKLRASQDKSLLGGAIVKIGSVQLDASLAGKLQRLEQQLKAA